MNKELFDSMRRQMVPSPETRAALSEQLARPVKKRPIPWVRCGAAAACAALVIGAFPLYHAMRSGQEPVPLHSYVTVESVTGFTPENTATVENTVTGGAGVRLESGTPHPGDAPSGALPAGTYIGDAPVQEGAEDYQKLMDHFNGTLPDWYGGAYLDSSGRLVVQLVDGQDPADKSLELQVLDWTGSGTVMFSSCKYSLNQLNALMDRLNALPDADPVCRGLMAGWGVDTEANRIELTLTQVSDHILSLLARLDPEDDMILVQIGQRAVADVENPAVSHVVPGGTTVPDDEDLIADEPYYDGAVYDLESLPDKLPEQMRPADTVQSVPEEDSSASTPSFDPNSGFSPPFSGSQS